MRSRLLVRSRNGSCIEGGDAPTMQGATTANTGIIQGRSNAAELVCAPPLSFWGPVMRLIAWWSGCPFTLGVMKARMACRADLV